GTAPFRVTAHKIQVTAAIPSGRVQPLAWRWVKCFARSSQSAVHSRQQSHSQRLIQHPDQVKRDWSSTVSTLDQPCWWVWARSGTRLYGRWDGNQSSARFTLSTVNRLS